MPEQPLLTLAIPTYNRAPFLRELLDVLLPQLLELDATGRGAELELLISDNCATDATPEITGWLEEQLAGTAIRRRFIRQTENIGSDRNFVFCFRQAAGRYFWLFGDDDIIRPGGLASIMGTLRGGDYDIFFLAPLPFYQDWKKEFWEDRWGRHEQVIRSRRHMALLVNIGMTFISGYIVNRQRLMELDVEPAESFVGTNLTQLSWAMPLLRFQRQSVVSWRRWVWGRAMNSGGYNIAEVFGERFLAVVNRLLPDPPRLAAIFPAFALRRWFPATVLELRERPDSLLDTSGTEEKLRPLFGRNLRFWVYTWPMLRLPLPTAKRYFRVIDMLNRVTEFVQVPGAAQKLRLYLRRRLGHAKTP